MASCVLAEGRLGLDALKHAYATGCPLSPDACRHAAKGGNLDALVWLREQGCAWDFETYEEAQEQYERSGDDSLLRFCRLPNQRVGAS
jgi:hypothetical protein